MNHLEHGCLDLPDGDGQPDACCSSGAYAACGCGTSILVCYMTNLCLEPLALSSRFLPCAALCIERFNGQLGGNTQLLLPHQQEQTLLAAATPNGVLLWILEEAYAAAADHLPAPTPLRLVNIEQQQCPSQALAVSSQAGRTGMLLAVGCGCTVVVWSLQQLNVQYRLDGHQGTITAVTFIPQQQHHLVSAAEDRTFKVWDLHEGQLLYQSSILGAAVPTCLALNATASRLTMGCADGSIRQFDLAQLPHCRELQALDISKTMQQVATAVVAATAAALQVQPGGPKTVTAAISAGAQGTGLQSLRQQLQQLSNASAHGNTNAGVGSPVLCGFPELLEVQSAGSGCVLGMQFVQLNQLQLQDDDDGAGGAASSSSCSLYSQQLLQHLLAPPSQLLVCTRRGLLLINTGSGEVECCYMFGMEAARIQGILNEANASAERVLSTPQPHALASYLQQPLAQQQQQQTKALAAFKALPSAEQPVAACCFAPALDQQRQHDPFTVCCCLASSSNGSFSIIQLGPSKEIVHECSSSNRSNSSSLEADRQACTAKQYRQHLSVFQKGALPVNSPLLDRNLRHSNSSGSSSNERKFALALPSGRHDGKFIPAAAAVTRQRDNAPLPASSVGGRHRATWSADIAGTLASKTAAAAAAAGKLSSTPGKHRRSSGAAPGGTKATPKKCLTVDKSVTFHRQIKSSGYGFVQPKIKLGQAKPAPIKVGDSNGKTAAQLLAKQLFVYIQFPLDAAQPQDWKLQLEQQLPAGQPVHNGGILRVTFAGDGCRLLTASSDKTARCLWVPTSKHTGAGTTFVGHTGPVTCIAWSHCGEYVLTASADRTAKLWSCSSASSKISFSLLHQQATGCGNKSSCNSNQAHSLQRSSSSSSKATTSCRITPRIHLLNRPSSSNTTSTGSPVRGGGSSTASQYQEFLSEVTAARFFYMDQMVVLSTGNKLHMCRYKLPEGPVDDDIQRLKATGSYSVAGSYSSSCQTILDMAAINSFASTLVLLACSNRSIELVDAATLQVSSTIADAHNRPVQRLAQPAASPFITHPRQMYELFSSAALDGVVKLWDVRSGSCVRSFTGHKHSSSQVPIGLTFSPCMRYLATGSEDNAAYVYDLRTCTLLAKLRPPGPQAGVIADVAFHPVKPQLVLGCMNGSLYWYGDTFQHVQTATAHGGGVVRDYFDHNEELLLV